MKMSGDMFEGKDYPTQWALNPSAYQNMSNDQVDWAALAQQWIKMKETVVPPAPPPPSIDSLCPGNDSSGEAPMDMDTKEDDIPPAPPAPTISGSDAWAQWSQWGHWNTSNSSTGTWEWTGVPPPGVTIGPDGKPVGVPTLPIIPPGPTISTTEFNVPPPVTPSLYSYNSAPPSAQPYNQQVSNFWSGESSTAVPSQPLLYMKGIRHTNRIPHMRPIDAVRCRNNREKTPEEDTTTTIDAAKRRQLPAWIREGLEKMEREKQKAVERERQEILRKQEIEARKKAEDEARLVLNPSKSKFDSDSEKEGDQEFETSSTEQNINKKNYERTPDVILRPRKSRFRDADSPEPSIAADNSPTPVSCSIPVIVKRSQEEILQDVMLKVRRSLTEILLEVTNEEIGVVCREVWNRARAKAPAGEHSVASFNNTAPLAQITRKLGLGIYGDSNSESEEEQNEQEQLQNNDSDEELMETLRRRQQAFKKTEKEIEARLAAEEENEDQYNVQQDNHIGNTSCRDTVDEKETVNIQRAASESLSSDGQSPREVNASADVIKAGTPSASVNSESSNSESTSSDTSHNSTKKNKKLSKKSDRDQRKRKSKSRSKSRSKKSRSRSSERTRKRSSRSRSVKSRKGRRSRSSNYRSSRKRRSKSRNRKRLRSRSRSCRRSRSLSGSRKWSRSRSNGKKKSHSHSRERRSRSRSIRRSRSRIRVKRKSSSRNRERSRSRSRDRHRSRSYVSRSRRRSQSRSRDRRRSQSKSHQWNTRDGKKSSHRFRN
ncbi:arginine/serine-rich protein PNISR-like isoform X1 [Vespa mandarinia]|uniref:arginine/serine-rich protein PNISR-like isoform X1 n=1 Tax=Vespa mandarinia TaxID=7446 RepID=UPI00160A0A14|nr:arginine/serine-rich protein PNISR-like isoform X1 [Vespa mandarinia]